MIDEAKASNATSAGTAPYISAASSDVQASDHVADATNLDRVPRLVERAKHGDKDAFGELYRLYHDSLYRLARVRLGAAAEDAVSETFLRAWAGLSRYRDTGAPFVAWLYGIARHVVLDEMAKRRRVEPRAEPPAQRGDSGVDDRLTLAAAIDRLPDEQRQVLELKFLAGLSNPEVAKALGKTVGAVNAKQWRALQALREVLGRE